MNSSSAASSRNPQSGLSLIDAVIALVILSSAAMILLQDVQVYASYAMKQAQRRERVESLVGAAEISLVRQSWEVRRDKNGRPQLLARGDSALQPVDVDNFPHRLSAPLPANFPSALNFRSHTGERLTLFYPVSLEKR